MGRLAWFAAAAITAGFMAAEYLPGRFATLYAESLGPLAGSMWLGAALQQLWKRTNQSIPTLPSPTLIAIVLFFGLPLLLGGYHLFWVDPWLFGLAVAPMWEAIKVLLARSNPVADTGEAQTSDLARPDERFV